MLNITDSRKKILTGFGIFMAAMLLLTLISRGIYAAGLPQVTTEQPKKASLLHEVRADGNVTEGRKLAVNLPEGLRIKEVFVRPGDRVEGGDILFVLDTDYLREKIEDAQDGLARLELQIATLEYNLQLMGEEKNREMDRANEDGLWALEEAQRALSRAREDEALARARLEEHLQDPVEETPEESRNRQQADYQNWKKELASAGENSTQAQGQVTQLAEKVSALEKEVDWLRSRITAAGGGGSGNGSDGAEAAGAGKTENGGDAGGAETGGTEAGPEAAGTGREAHSDNGTDPSGASADASGPAADAGEKSDRGKPEEETHSGGKTDTVSQDGGTSDGLFEELTRKEEELKQARRELQAARQAGDQAAGALSGLQENTREMPDFTQEDASLEAWEEKKKTLQEQLRQAERATQDAQAQMEEQLRQAQRSQEDSAAPEKTDATLGLTRIDCARQAARLAALQDCLGNQGMIPAEITGEITQVHISPGELTGSGAALTYADTSQPLQFLVPIDKEQKKYVEQGMDARLLLSGQQGSGMEVTVDYLAADEEGSGGYTARIVLPEGVGRIGQSGVFSLSVQSDIYQYCIPLDALHQDGNGRDCVYILSERNTILGKELTVQKTPVEVLDRNEKTAAVSSGAIDSQTRLITSTTKEFSEGDVVRMKD